MTIYGIGSIPCDTSMRDILDGIDPDDLRPLFKGAFRQLQRGKPLEQMVFMDGCYLLNLDGIGYFSSSTLYSDACMEKVSRKTGKITYYLQTVGAAIVHPYFKEVIPLCPEIIRKQDGETKVDCERNAVKRLLRKFRQDHPHLQVIVNENSLSSDAPHIKDLEQYNCHYILGVKEGIINFCFSMLTKFWKKAGLLSFRCRMKSLRILHIISAFDLTVNIKQRMLPAKNRLTLLVKSSHCSRGKEKSTPRLSSVCWRTPFSVRRDSTRR